MERERTDETVEEAAARRRPTAARIALRLAIGGAVIGFLLWRGDAGRIATVIGNARLSLLAAAFATIIGGLVVSAVRWQAFLRALGLGLRAPTLVRLYFVGMFFNAFLPTGVGGDAYKALRLRRGEGSLAPAFASVLLDRFAGLVGLALIGMWGAAARASVGDGRGQVRLAAVLTVGVLGGAAALLAFGERLLAWPRIAGSRLGQRAGRLVGRVLPAARDRRAAPVGFSTGLAFQGLVLLEHWLVARSLGIAVPVAALACVVVIASLAAMIPLTVNGLGFREGAYVWGLGAYGVSHAAALAFALLVLGTMLGASALGGLVYVLRGGEVRREAFEGSQGPGSPEMGGSN